MVERFANATNGDALLLAVRELALECTADTEHLYTGHSAGAASRPKAEEGVHPTAGCRSQTDRCLARPIAPDGNVDSVYEHVPRLKEKDKRISLEDTPPKKKGKRGKQTPSVRCCPTVKLLLASPEVPLACVGQAWCTCTKKKDKKRLFR